MKKIVLLSYFGISVFVNICCADDKSLNATSDFSTAYDSEEAMTEIETEITEIDTVLNDEKTLIATRRYFYLTIDDAPVNGSEYIDSILLIEKVKTSLFIVGSPIDGSKRFLRYYETFLQNPYIEIYNHSYSHANHKYTQFYKNPESVFADFEKNQSEYTIAHKIARLPGRNLWMVGERKKNCRQTGTSSAELLAADGYEIFGWDVEWKYDPKDYQPEQSVDELIIEIEDICNSSNTFTSNHVVLLIHNQMFGKINDKNNLQELIEKLKENNFTFEYLSSYTALTQN